MQRHPGIEKLAAFTHLAATGDIEEGSVLAEAVEASPWFARRVAQMQATAADDGAAAA